MRAALLCFALAVATPVVALAETPPVVQTAPSPALAALLVKLGQHGERLEEMKRRGNYTLTGHLDQLDGKGKVESTKDLTLKMTATGTTRGKAEIVKLLEDGVDKTEEAKKKAKKNAGKKHKKKTPEFRVPFLPSEQPFYDFELIGKDDRYPGKIKVGFHAKEPSEERFNGTAWIDEKSGELDSMGFSLSQNPTFVDEVDATIVFGTPTALGRAPSELTFEAKGGFLFIHKHFKGHATLSNATLSKASK